MSRGEGKKERALLGMILHQGKPMTFGDMRRFAWQGRGGVANATPALPKSMERSMRRALHRLSKKGLLIALGNGEPTDPLRYFIAPVIIGMMGETRRGTMLRKALEAEVAKISGKGDEL
jgi:hypothetical protein